MSIATPTQTKASEATGTARSNVIVSVNPATGRELGSVNVASAEDVKAAMTRARQAQESWYDLGLQRRIAIMRDVKNAMYRNQKLIVDTLIAETGKPSFEALIEYWPTIEALAYCTRIARKTLATERRLVVLIPHHVHRIEHRPYGVILAIAPWNFPLFLSLPPIIEALIAGNSVVYKPSEFATQTGEAIAKVLWEGGVPRDVFQIVHGAGDVGATLIRERPDKIVFTGSPATGRKIAAAAGEQLIPLTLELGGKDAAIVLEDADLDRTAAGVTWAGLLNAGQACVSVERLYVRREVADQLVEKMAEILNEHVRLGPGDANDTTMGAITTGAQFKIINNHVREAVENGARIVVGGRAVEDSAGQFYLPTLMTNVTPEMRIVREETFGPIIPIIPVDSDEEALRLANDTRYGLTGSVWTRNKARGTALARRMKVGHASVNDHVLSTSAAPLPWGGIGDSGYGRMGGPEGLLEMTTPHVIITHRFGVVPREIFWYPYTKLKHSLVQRVVNTLYAPTWVQKLRAIFKG